MIGFVILILAIALGVWLIDGGPADLIRAIGGHGSSPDASRELKRLREEVDRLSADVARLSDEQTFLLRLMETQERDRLEVGGEDEST